jgi:ribosomal protein L11 methyltransferase
VSESRYPYVHVDVPAESADEVAAELWDLGVEGVETRDAATLSGPTDAGSVTLVAYVSEEARAEAIAAELGERFPARVEIVVGDEWRDRWREYFKPLRVGARLVVRPSWEEVVPWDGEIVLTIDPGRAFGSGIHETTKLVLREIDRRVRGGERVLDVGAGSGILSIAAALLGASEVRAVDNDADTVSVVDENAKANGVSEIVVADATPIDRVDGAYDLVLANIEARVLIELAAPICARVAAGGTLVLSGVLRPQLDEVVDAYAAFDHQLTGADGEWVAVILRRPEDA